jgi:putative hydrolase of the HAD superfamily
MSPSIWPIVKEIKKKYRVGLLTGMYSGMLDAIFKSGVMPEIEWDVIVDSSVFGFKKPNIEIYKIAEEKAGFLGEEILFVDNTKKNLETAQSLGWQTFLYDSSDYVGSTEKLRTLNLG